MKKFPLSLLIISLLSIDIFADTTSLTANFFTKDGKHLIAEFLQMKNDTIYVRIVKEDSTHSYKAIHKSAFDKVVFLTGEYLNLTLSDYRKFTIGYNTVIFILATAQNFHM